MKKILILALLSFIFYNNSHAKGVVVYCSDCEYITIAAELPDSAQFYSEEYKSYIDVGYKYSQFWILWVPVWNSKGTYCLTTADKEVYFDVTEAELEELAKEYNLDLPENPIPFWDKIGGKLLLGAVILFGIWGYLGKGKKSDDKDNVQKAAA